jgi:hypothetical protein
VTLPAKEETMMQNVQQVLGEAKQALQQAMQNPQTAQEQLQQAAQNLQAYIGTVQGDSAIMLQDVYNAVYHACNAAKQPENAQALQHSYEQAIRACEQAEGSLGM